MIIVEFCGNPGSGKTTLCDEIESLLKERGYHVRNLQKRIWPKTFKEKLVAAITRYRFCTYLPNRKIKNALKVLEPYLSEESLINWPERILESFYRIRKAEKDGVEIGLFDEGCLQFITSVFHGTTIAEEAAQLVAVLEEEIYNRSTLFVDCNMDLEKNYQQLVQRNRPNDRFLAGNKEQNMAMLSQKRKNIDMIFDMLQKNEKLEIDLYSGEEWEVIDKIAEEICMKISLYNE